MKLIFPFEQRVKKTRAPPTQNEKEIEIELKKREIKRKRIAKPDIIGRNHETIWLQWGAGIRKEG